MLVVGTSQVKRGAIEGKSKVGTKAEMYTLVLKIAKKESL